MRSVISLTAAALLAAWPASAQDSGNSWSDDVIWATVSETHGLDRIVRTRIFQMTAVREEMRRAGVVPVCREISKFIGSKAESAREDYRSLIISQVRTVVPDGLTFQERFSVSPSGHRFGRLIGAVERKDPQLFAELYTSIETELLPEVKSLATVDGEWRGPFADWDFDGRNNTIWASACMIAMMADPTTAKTAFDGFFKERASK